MHEKDQALLELIKASFGVGKITKQDQESIQFRVFSIRELKDASPAPPPFGGRGMAAPSGRGPAELIISHFEKYPLMTNK